MPHHLIGLRDLSYDAPTLNPAPSGKQARIVRWQTWLLIPPGLSLEDPLLASIAFDNLRAILTCEDYVDAFCCVFYTDLRLDAAIGCHEWARRGEWSKVEEGRRRDYSQHRWTRHDNEDSSFIKYILKLPECSDSSRDVDTLDYPKGADTK